MATRPAFEQPEKFTFTQPPNPSWKYGDNIENTELGKKWMEGTKVGWKTIDTSTAEDQYLYRLLLSAIVPRPVAFVSTVSPDGVENIAPYSWFTQACRSPPVISIAAVTGHLYRDTARNIKQTKEFTVNIISHAWVDAANIACTDTPPDFSEWPISGLTKEPSVLVKPPRVRESGISLECELLEYVDIKHPTTGELGSTVILGLVKYIHVRNDLMDERGVVDPGKLQPIARLGGITYAQVTHGYELTRKDWGRDQKELEEAQEKLTSNVTV